jgi:hypothetical protein
LDLDLVALILDRLDPCAKVDLVCWDLLQQEVIEQRARNDESSISRAIVDHLKDKIVSVVEGRPKKKKKKKISGSACHFFTFVALTMPVRQHSPTIA